MRAPSSEDRRRYPCTFDQRSPQVRILPPRLPNHRRLDPARSQIDRSATVLPLPLRDSPDLDRYVVPPWDRPSPERLAIDDDLPDDPHARPIDAAVDRLDRTALFASWAGVGSRSHRPDLRLKIVSDEMQTGRHSPGQGAEDTRERCCLLCLGCGIKPSRSRCSAFRDRVGAWLRDWNPQVLE